MTRWAFPLVIIAAILAGCQQPALSLTDEQVQWLESYHARLDNVPAGEEPFPTLTPARPDFALPMAFVRDAGVFRVCKPPVADWVSGIRDCVGYRM